MKFVPIIMTGLIYSLKSLLLTVPLLISIAYITLAERKILGSMQRRLGPNTVGSYGLLQPFADGLKLVIKEWVGPSMANSGLFQVAPLVAFSLSLLGWAQIPFGKGCVVSDIKLGIMYLLAISSLGVYGVIFSGWSSNNKYSLMGGLRSCSQMISYEVIMGMILMLVLLCVGNFNLSDCVESQKAIWYIVPLAPGFLMFIIAILAETNRHPMDLPEAESELVAGFFTEYSGLSFAYFFLGEYCSIILMSCFTVILFLGGYDNGYGFVLGLKTALILYGFIWVRASLPRYRYAQLMEICWKSLLPVVLGFFLFVGGILIGFDFAL